MKNSGYLVETKDGKHGRTYHSKGLINGKIPVYLATEFREFPKNPKNPEGDKFTVAVAWSDTAILCDPKTLKSVGMID